MGEKGRDYFLLRCTTISAILDSNKVDLLRFKLVVQSLNGNSAHELLKW